MRIQVDFKGTNYAVDLSSPIDISIPLVPGSDGPNCFWAPIFDAQPVKAGDWIGDVEQGGGVNFKNVQINPHGNGTHTECVGHISSASVSINSVLKNFHFVSKVVSIYPQLMENKDKVITYHQIVDLLGDDIPEALIIRTLPNGSEKQKRIYSGTNPPYMDHKAIQFLVDKGIKHLLLDLPSVDREEDGGKLSAHKAFWNYPNIIDTEKTITEMVFVDNAVSDGLYLLNLQIVSFELDASPSKPILYIMKKL
ncbi:MAG: cyclase family protein [Bacteroidota bacterium]